MCIVRRLRIGLGSFKSRFCRFHDERSSTRNTIRHASIPSTHRATRYIMSYSVRRSTTKRFYPVNTIERGGGFVISSSTMRVPPVRTTLSTSCGILLSRALSQRVAYVCTNQKWQHDLDYVLSSKRVVRTFASHAVFSPTVKSNHFPLGRASYAYSCRAALIELIVLLAIRVENIVIETFQLRADSSWRFVVNPTNDCFCSFKRS